MKKLFATIMFVSLAMLGFSQGSITGKIVDAGTDESLIGAAVMVQGETSTGTITDYDGNFTIGNLSSGDYTMTISYLGYTAVEKTVTITSGTTELGTITMEEDPFSLSEIEVVADYVVERRTPVAVSTLNKKKIENVLGSRDIPMALNLTPSVYATEQGGGSGDSRINVRGFDQKNVAIMINGVPINDMENGWVYWSNWDGIGDATSSIQLQRGLSAVNLATPSIGGTMNIVTSPADKKAGGAAKFEVGSGGFLKSTLTGHSGMIGGKFAMSASVVRKVGNGLVDKTWTDAWAYYLGTSFKISNNHKIELFGMGAPQRHGQNLYRQNVAAYGHDYAKSIDGYDTAAFEKFPEANDSLASSARLYSENWNYVSNYDGKQFWNGKEHDRYSKDFINERENFYNKPLVNLNWYATWSNKITQYTTLYWSGGKGGGSGTMGSVKYNYHAGYESPSRIVDWNATIANNSAGEAKGILRNSRNNQNTIGAISKFKIKWNDQIKSTVGVDWRTATIEHFREVRDLLGGTFFNKVNDQFNPNQHVGLGDKVDYFNTNTVDWIGGFAQTEYNADRFSMFGMVGISSIKYSFTDHFGKDDSDATKEKVISSPSIPGLQVKGGANYRINENINVFTNLGYVSKVPIFDAVIDDKNGIAASDPQNEKFYAFEGGANFFSDDNSIQMRFSGYYTQWKDRTRSFYVDEQSGSSDLVYVTGMDQTHAGIEMDLSYKPMDLVEFGLTASFADWKNTNDVKGQYRTYDSIYIDKTYEFYVKDLKVGDAPQNQLVASVTFFPIDGLETQFLWSRYSKFYANWDPFSRTDSSDREQSWKIPTYSLLNMHLSYKLPFDGRFGAKVFVHGFNLLDALYISDAGDNSKYNSYKVKDDDGNKYIKNPHSADAADVFLGSPRKFVAGVKFTF